MKKIVSLLLCLVLVQTVMPLRAHAMQISVKNLSGKHNTIEVEGYYSIAQVKERIYKKLEYPVRNQLLYFNGNLLDDSTTLDENGIKKDNTLVLNLRFFVDIDPEITHGQITAAPTALPAEEAVELSISPDPGYMLASLNVTDGSGNSIPVENNSFLMPPSDVNITANFVPIPKAPVPATGDNSSMGIWSALLIGFAALAVLTRKKKA